MTERLVRIGIPAQFKYEVEAREETDDWLGKGLNAQAARLVVGMLVEAGEIDEDDEVDVEFRADPSLKPEDEIRPIWIADIYIEPSGKEVEENVRLYIYHAPEFDNQN